MMETVCTWISANWEMVTVVSTNILVILSVVLGKSMRANRLRGKIEKIIAKVQKLQLKARKLMNSQLAQELREEPNHE